MKKKIKQYESTKHFSHPKGDIPIGTKFDVNDKVVQLLNKDGKLIVMFALAAAGTMLDPFQLEPVTE